MRTEDYNYILIAGCQRSGTTLLGQILGSQDRFLLVDEPDGVMDFVKLLASRAGERHGKL